MNILRVCWGKDCKNNLDFQFSRPEHTRKVKHDPIELCRTIFTVKIIPRVFGLILTHIKFISFKSVIYFLNFQKYFSTLFS